MYSPIEQKHKYYHILIMCIISQNNISKDSEPKNALPAHGNEPPALAQGRLGQEEVRVLRAREHVRLVRPPRQPQAAPEGAALLVVPASKSATLTGLGPYPVPYPPYNIGLKWSFLDRFSSRNAAKGPKSRAHFTLYWVVMPCRCM